MDQTDRDIINAFQGNFPITEHPFAVAGNALGLNEEDLISRIESMLADNTLTRFGPLYNADTMGGAVTLCGMAVPEDDFDRIADIVNAFDEVAHNYERTHHLNMWFVVGAETREQIDAVLRSIEEKTGLPVRDMPKKSEFFVGLILEA